MPDFLSVSAAAELLGVHVDTVRRWTTDGKLPEVRTPGGHRRIPREAIDRVLAEKDDGSVTASRVPSVGDPADEAWAEHAAVHARYEIRQHPGAAWNQAMTGRDRSERRETGRQLMGLLLRHVADQGDPEARVAEIRRLAWGYALAMKDRGLPVSEALRATLFFRDVLTESTAYHPRFEAGDEPDQIGLVRKVNGFMNEVQMTIAQAYEAEDA